MLLKFYKSSSTLSVDTWVEKKLAMLQIAPVAGGAPKKGQPKEGDHIYDYEKAVRISISTDKLLLLAFKLRQLASGATGEIKEFADPSKGGHEGVPKSLLIKSTDKGNISVNLFQGDNKTYFYLDYAEAYAVAKWMEITYQLYYMLHMNDKVKPNE